MKQFRASIVSGDGRGRTIGSPTLNLALESIPEDLEDGVYACFVSVEKCAIQLAAVMHYGPRPTFQRGYSCEVHIIDVLPEEVTATLIVEVVDRIRAVKEFKSTDALKDRIQEDIACARVMLDAHVEKIEE